MRMKEEKRVTFSEVIDALIDNFNKNDVKNNDHNM